MSTETVQKPYHESIIDVINNLPNSGPYLGSFLILCDLISKTKCPKNQKILIQAVGKLAKEFEIQSNEQVIRAIASLEKSIKGPLVIVRAKRHQKDGCSANLFAIYLKTVYPQKPVKNLRLLAEKNQRNFSSKTIAKIFHGRNADLQTILSLCRVLGIIVEEYFLLEKKAIA